MNASKKILTILVATLISAGLTAQIIKWERVYGASEYEYGRSIQQTIDGAYIVGGTSSSYSAATDMYLLRLNGNGSFRWHKVFGYGNDEWCMSVKQTADSGFILCGYTNSIGTGGYDVFLVKTDSLGNEMWHHTYGGPDWDFGTSVDTTSDGGYIITGSTYSYGAGGEDVLLLKTDGNGNELWYNVFGGFSDENGTEVHQTIDDGGYIISGRTKSFSLGNYDMWVIKTTPTGDTAWTHTYGSPYEDGLNSVRQTIDSGYIVGGYTYMSHAHNESDMYARKLNKLGATTVILYDSIATGNSGVQSILQTYDSCYFTLGSCDYCGGGQWDFQFIKWNSGFAYLNGGSRGSSKDELAYQCQQTLDSGYVMVGNTTTWGNGKSDVFVVKLDKNFMYTALPIVGTNDLVREELDVSMNIFPNPANDLVILSADEKLFSGKGEMHLCDITGKQVLSENEDLMKNVSGKIQFRFSVKDLASGIYLLSLESDAGVFTRKLVVRH